MARGLRVQERDGRWAIDGDGPEGLALANEFIGYLADRNYSPRTIRGYAFDLSTSRAGSTARGSASRR